MSGLPRYWRPNVAHFDRFKGLRIAKVFDLSAALVVDWFVFGGTAILDVSVEIRRLSIVAQDERLTKDNSRFRHFGNPSRRMSIWWTVFYRIKIVDPVEEF